MKKLSCTQCGASISPETLTCEYCGSVFLNSQNEIIKTKPKAKEEIIAVPNIENEELNNIIINHLKEHSRASVFLAVVNIFWILFAIIIMGGVFGLFKTITFFSFFPLFIVFAAVLSSIRNIVISTGFKFSREITSLKSGDYILVYNAFKEREEKKHSLENVYIMMLIGFFKLRKFDDVSALILGLPTNELAHLVCENVNILNIAEALNIKTPRCSEDVHQTHIH